MNISLTPQSEAIVSKYMAQGYSVEEIIEQALKSFDNQGHSYTEWLQREVQAGLQQAQSGKFSNRSIDEIIAAAKVTELGALQLEEYFNVLAPDDIRLKGTRIGIESILYEYIYRCKTPEEIAEQFHTVTLEQVYATILYYLHYRSKVDAYLADWLEFSRTMREEQQRNPSPARIRFRQMRQENTPKLLQEM